jgi:ubiquinone/menaquinone biosynthesis C-methylase UbiE
MSRSLSENKEKVLIQCRLCDADKTLPFTNEGEWQVHKCSVCGFVFVVPLPEEEYLRAHYQQYLPSDEDGIYHWRKLMIDVFERSLSVIKRESICSGRKLLDVGCGYGFFLEEANREGWSIQGVEPCEHAHRYSQKNGLKVDLGDLFQQRYQDNSFDVVTMFYVLEHVRDPLSYLREAYRVLKSGGLLLVRVPHTTPIVKLLKAFRIPNRLYDTPSHLSDFSPRTLATALCKTGFIDIKTFPGGSTRPYPFGECIVSVTSGWLADALYWISAGKWLLPGVSKTTTAKKK